MQSNKSKDLSPYEFGHTQHRSIVQGLTVAYEDFNKAKAALRHIENKLEAVPTSSAVLNSVMDTKKHSGSTSTRKVSRKDGRYVEETVASLVAPKLSCPKSSKEKTSRSPLRATTLENNIKKSSRVEFREPIASYRDATGRTSSYLTSSQLEAQHLLSDLNCNDLPNSDERLSRIVYERDTRDLHSQEFEPGHSCSVNDTIVRFLNDHEAISALQNTEALSQCERTDERASEGYQGCEELGVTNFPNTFYNKEQKGFNPSEMIQSSTLSSVSLRLENLRKRQPDAKLEKLKERIRKQCEQSEELAEKGRTSAVEQPLATNLETAMPTTKVRKVANAPPAPTYKGFNPVETKVRTPDGKVWHEQEFHNISRELYSDLMLKPSESGKIKEKSEKSSRKKACKPLRKVQKMTPVESLDHGASGHIISTSSWREGQKIVKKVLGPSPKIVQEKRAQSTDRTGRERDVKSGQTLRAESDTRVEACRRSRTQSSERPKSRVHSEGNLMKASSEILNEKTKDGNTVNKEFLPAEIQGILSDLQLDALGQISKQGLEEMLETEKVLPARVSRSRSPTKRKSEKLNPNDELHAISKKRHYDANVVRQYIARQQEERKKRQNEEKKAQQEASELKHKRLQELYKKQKEAFNKAKTASEVTVSNKLQETYSKFLLRQSRIDDPSDYLPIAEDSQKKTGYQPSGESDKENKGQDRPTSASSSSDLSLSEPQQPLPRNDLVELTWLQPDRLSPAHGTMQKQPSDMAKANHCSETSLKKYKTSAECKPVVVAWEKAGGRQLPFQSQHCMSSFSPQSLMKNTNHYRNKLDRIEAIKATAASLSNRIESEAKKLAGAGVQCGAFISSEHDAIHTFVDSGRWVKPLSPPVHDEEDIFTARIRTMLGVPARQSCDDGFPGVGSVHELKNGAEHMKSVVPRMSGVESQEMEHDKTPLHMLDVPVQQQGRLYEEKVGVKSQDSSSGSISEGPLLSEGSLSEDDGVHATSSPVKLSECLKMKEFCAEDSNTFKPINEFQKQSEKYPSFPTNSSLQFKAPWEELAKGSPHSVINIFTKNYHVLQKGHVEKSERCSPILHPLLPVVSPVNSYEDDFASSQDSISSAALKKTVQEPSSASSVISIHEEMPSRRSPYELCPSEMRSLHSPGSRSAVSSSSSSSRRSKKVEELETRVRSTEHLKLKEDKVTESSEHCSQDGRQGGLSNSSSRKNERGLILDVSSSHSLTRSPSEHGKLKKMPVSPSSSHSSASHSHSQSEVLADTSAVANVTDKSRPQTNLPTPIPDFSGFCSSDAFVSLNVQPNQSAYTFSAGSIRFAPAILQHRMTAELSYLDAIEESVRQLSDIERTRGISLAQQESVSLAQILKAQQQRHERDLALLKMKAEQETLDTQRQLQETRQKAAEARAECLQQLVQTRQEAAEKLEETASKLVTQQAQAALLTADAARQIMEMTELARSQMRPVTAPAASITSLFDDQRKQHTDFMKHLQTRAEAESIPSSSQRESPSPLSLDKNESRSPQQEEAGISTEEAVHTAANSSLRSDSIPSLPDEKDSNSIATEYSLKFDESMTEDEIEQQSFRSLLPSESHRRFSMEKKQTQRDDSDEDASAEKAATSSVKEFTIPFSSGQDSFSRFTMEMVRQYMKEEEMRAAHQSSLLHLREKALKEKTKAELAWLDLQKKRLRDKGEDDKMPPIRKKQRGLLLKLRQEQAEIKRLKEANKAARKERQLILKQQEEIERMRQTTIKLQERLKSAAEGNLELNSLGSSEERAKPSSTSSPALTDLETRSTSPVSISGSETSSIMQKLKKMRTHMDEKFLTKREQKLMQRRHHAEELLEWRRRLDAEEAEVRRIEKQALAAWDKDRVKQKISNKELGESSPDHKETVDEEASPVPSHSQINSGSSIPEEISSLPAESIVPEDMNQGQSVSPDHSICSEDAYSREFESTSSPDKHSPSKTNTSITKQKSKQETISNGSQVKLSVNCHNISGNWSDESLSLTHSETASDQSDIESRIRALRQELKQRKAIAEQLKKEQKKRYKERLKAQEASLIKQLESYDEFIKKTQAELSKDLEASPTTKPQIKTPSSVVEKPKIKAPPLHGHETAKSRKSLTDSEKSRSSLEPVTEHALTTSEELHTALSKKYFEPEVISEEPFRDSVPVPKSEVRSKTEFADVPDSVTQPFLRDLLDSSKAPDLPVSKLDDFSGDESVVSSHRTDIQEELEHTKSEESDLEEVYSQRSDKSEPLLNLSIEKLIPTEDLGNCNVLLKESERLDNFVLKDKNVFSVEDDAGSDLSVSSVRSVKSERSPEILCQKTLEKASVFTDVILPYKQPSYSEFDIYSPRKEVSTYRDPVTETYKDDSELSSPRKEYSYSETFTEVQDYSLIKDKTKQEQLEPRSPSPTSFEMIEHQCKNTLSSHDSIPSERMVELRSPTELSKERERSDVGYKEQSPFISLPLSPSPDVEYIDTLMDFNIGDRVLINGTQAGTLRFKGRVLFASGNWAGVELDKLEGSSNGTYDGIVYFHCRDNHGIFVPPHHLAHLPKSFETFIDTIEDSVYDDKLICEQKQDEKSNDNYECDKNKLKQYVDDMLEGVSVEKMLDASFVESSGVQSSLKENTVINESSESLKHAVQISSFKDGDSGTIQDEKQLSELFSSVVDKVTSCILDESFENLLNEQLKKQPSFNGRSLENKEKLPSVYDKSVTPLLDLLAKEKDHLDSHLKAPPAEAVETLLQEHETVIIAEDRVSLLTDSVLSVVLKDSITQIQEIMKVRKEKIQLTNRDLQTDITDESMPRMAPKLLSFHDKVADSLQSLLKTDHNDVEREKTSSPDLCPRPESPVFGTSGQEDLAKRLVELELNQKVLSTLGNDQSWFEDDFGLHSASLRQQYKKEGQQRLQQVIELAEVMPKPEEESVCVVSHTEAEVQTLAELAAEELWKWKKLGHDLQSVSASSDFLGEDSKCSDMESISKRVYKQAVFDLTKEMFQDIFTEDPNLGQPPWMKPCRVTPACFRRVHNPSDLHEIKTFIAAEVLKMFGLKKEKNHKTEMQSMMKFGQKKHDQVDHILVQELHEEEAQWINYDEDELCVKMQLADGIFDALIKDTINVLNQIQDKRRQVATL